MKVELYPAGIVEVLNGPRAGAVQRLAAAAAVADAKRTGPRNPAHHSHVIDQLDVGETRRTSDGAVTSIEWRSPFWHFVEFGSPPTRPLTRGAQNAGLRVIERA